MRWRGQLSFKFLLLGLSLLLLALISIGMTMWVTRQLDGGAAAVNEAGRLRMQAWRLVSARQGGRSEDEIRQLVGQMNASIELLHRGDKSRPLFVPWDEPATTSFAALSQSWQTLQPYWQTAPEADAQVLTQLVDRFVFEVEQLVFAIEGKMTRLTAILNLFQFFMMGLAVVAAVFTLYVGYLYVIDPLRYRAWTIVSRLNTRHGRFAWITLGSLLVTDAYIALVASGALTDLRLIN